MQLEFNIKAPLSISELTRRIKDTLEAGFSDVWVVGEIANMRVPSSGHIYLTLKDRDAQIKAVFFKFGNKFLKFRPEDGLEVIVRGKLSLYEPRGEYQIIVDYMEPKGVGALQLAFLQLRDKLQKEGLFDPAHKRPLPTYPKRVGVVTSPTGAAFRDILNVLGRRAPGVSVLLAPASVQGDAAPGEIANAIADLNEYGGLDVIIVGRGGGSMEDLAAFNTEVVARAIYNSSIPVISAVGHEVDFTISDFVADLRAATPSAAAELVAASEEGVRESLAVLTGRMRYVMSQSLALVRSRLDSEVRALPDMRRTVHEHMLKLDDYSTRITTGCRRQLAHDSERLESLASSLMRQSPANTVLMRRETVTGLQRRLEHDAAYRIKEDRQSLMGAAARLSALEPLAPLRRGFAVARLVPDMAVVRNVGEVSVGDALLVQFADGELDCRVEGKRLVV